MLTLSLAWRNVWRNKLRSGVVAAAVGIGLLGGVYSIAFYNGMTVSAVRDAAETTIGDAQLHHPKHLLDDDPKYAIPDADARIAAIRKLPKATAAAKRLQIPAMVSTAATGAGVKLVGVVPEQERAALDLHDHMIEGDFFETKKRLPAVIGKKLADKLDASVGSKIVVATQRLDGEIVYAAFKVVGVYHTFDSRFDESNVFTLFDDLADRIGFDPTSATEILCSTEDVGDAKALVSSIEATFAADVKNDRLVVQYWGEVSPILEMLESTKDQFAAIFLFIILLALSFGVVNTMLMAIMERRRELGMLMAIGTNRRLIFSMILLETIFLTLTGSLAGLIVGYGLVEATAATGVDLSLFGEGLRYAGFSAVVYPYLDFGYYVAFAAMSAFAALVASLYPARKALKLNPVEATRIDV
jgi:ABC-type lipoprotein release transport system permease subunit